MRGTMLQRLERRAAALGIANRVTSATLVQIGDQLSGTPVAVDGANGTLNGTITGDRFAGTLRIDTASDSPTDTALERLPLTGTAGVTGITLMPPALSLDRCGGTVTDVELRLIRGSRE